VVEVGVPAGTVPGHKIRVKGKGLNGGDLHFKTVLLPHASYGVDGSDLLCAARIPVWKAALGGTLEIRTPDGVVRLKVPAGTQPGKRFRLGGHGLPSPGKKRGNFILEVQVVVPESLSLEERACWVKLEELALKR
jgi:curved DNA-binding protein